MNKEDEFSADILAAGAQNPLPDEQAKSLLLKIIAKIRASAISRGDNETAEKLADEAQIEQIIDEWIAKRKGDK